MASKKYGATVQSAMQMAEKFGYILRRSVNRRQFMLMPHNGGAARFVPSLDAALDILLSRAA